MNWKKFLEQLNIFTYCKNYGFLLWQCPSFLFLIMGLVIITSALIAYLLGNRYIEDPIIVILIVLLLSTILLAMAFVITQSFEKLAQTNRMKSEFINIISHQLQTPIANLKWVTDLLMSGRLGRIEEGQLEYFRILKENIGRMRELITDLLTVSRLETATLPLKKEQVSLINLVEELLSEFKPFIKASNAEVIFEKESNLPFVFTDSFQIKQVIKHLLNNAIRYIKEKGKIKILLANKGKNIYFEIEDNGVGIPKKDQKYIFQKFFRSENVLRYQTQGSGLGLYIAKSIIEKSGGKIGFQSEENKGSTFWFTLPLK